MTTEHINLVGPVVDAATAAGADSIGGPQFSFSNPSAGKAPAARAALVDARGRADDAAAAIGYRITGVRSITIDPQSDGSTASPLAASSAAGVTGSATTRPPTPVSPGRQEVDATVTVVYIMAPA